MLLTFIHSGKTCYNNLGNKENYNNGAIKHTMQGRGLWVSHERGNNNHN